MSGQQPIWTMSTSQYQSMRGVKQPWICEISPMQYAHMSKRQQAQYDEKRSREWQASADCKQEYHEAISAAYTAGAFDLNDSDVHEDAKKAVFWLEQEQQKKSAEERMAQATEENQIRSFDEISIGDEVYDIMCGGYVRVVKKSRLSCRAEYVGDAPYLKGKTILCKLGAIQRKSYNDMQAAASA